MVIFSFKVVRKISFNFNIVGVEDASSRSWSVACFADKYKLLALHSGNFYGLRLL